MVDFSHLVGTPYDKDHDCYWLVRHVLREGAQVNLPEKPLGWRRYGTSIRWPTEVRRFDVLFFARNDFGMVDHIGVAVSDKEFMHANELAGQVVQEPIRRYAHVIRAIGRPHDIRA
jgi:cell wall-associated NlpC family hydrolase